TVPTKVVVENRVARVASLENNPHRGVPLRRVALDRRVLEGVGGGVDADVAAVLQRVVQDLKIRVEVRGGARLDGDPGADGPRGAVVLDQRVRRAGDADQVAVAGRGVVLNLDVVERTRAGEVEQRDCRRGVVDEHVPGDLRRLQPLVGVDPRPRGGPAKVV